MRRKASLRLSARDLVVAQEGRTSRESETSVASDARTKLAGSLATSACTTQERMGPCGSDTTKSDLANGYDQDLGRTSSWMGVSGERDRLFTREIVGWNLSDRCRTEEAVAAVEQAVLDRLPAGSRENDLTLTTDNGTQFTSSRFMETLAQLGITHRRTAYHHPEGNSYIERFHRSLKEEEVWTSEYRSLTEARENIGRYLEEYNHDRPHRGIENRTPHEAFMAFTVLTKNEALNV